MVAAATAAGVLRGHGGGGILTKRLTRTETITCILFWLTAIQLVIGLIACLWDGDMAIPSAAMLPWLLVIGAGRADRAFLPDHGTLHRARLGRHADGFRPPARASRWWAWWLYAEPAAMGRVAGGRADLRRELPQHPDQPPARPAETLTCP